MDFRHLVCLIFGLMILFGLNHVSVFRQDLFQSSTPVAHLLRKSAAEYQFITPRPSSSIDFWIDSDRRCIGRGSFGRYKMISSHFICSQRHNCSVESGFSSFQRRVEQFLICSKAFQKSNIPFLFTLTDKSYINALGNFAAAAQLSGFDGLLVIAMDHTVVPFLEDSKVPFVQYCWRNQDDIGNVKFAVAGKILSVSSYDLWFSEMDVFWTPGLTPLRVDLASVDVAVSAHSYHPEINLGIWAIRNNARTNNFMNTILSYAIENPGYTKWIGTADQKLFDAVLRGPLNPTVQYRFPNLKQVILTWKYLEFNQFYHNMDWNFEDSAHRVLTHISFGITRAEQRIEFAKTWLLWQDPTYNEQTDTVSWFAYKTFDYKAMLIKALWLGMISNRTVVFPTAFPPIEIDRLACNFDYRPCTFYDKQPPASTARILISNLKTTFISCSVRGANTFVWYLPSKFDKQAVEKSISSCPQILNVHHWIIVTNTGEVDLGNDLLFAQKIRWSLL